MTQSRMNKLKNSNKETKEKKRMPQREYADNTSINNTYHTVACTLRDTQSEVLKESHFQVTGNHTKKFMKKQELPNSWGELHQLFRAQLSKVCSMDATGSRAWLPPQELTHQAPRTEQP